MPIERDKTTHGVASAFDRTHWSVVLSARNGSAEEATAAMECLCRTYWWPLYAFVRRRGYQAHDAQDLTQEFFTHLLAKDFLRTVDRSKGTFRSFLLASLNNFIAKDWRRASAQKRGGQFTFISTDAEFADQQYLQVQATNLSPEQLFDKQWATTLLNQALSRLQEEFVAAGKGARFEALKIFLPGERVSGSYVEVAARLETTEGALKMAVSRMRERYGELLLAEIANTVSSPTEAEEELRALFAALS